MLCAFGYENWAIDIDNLIKASHSSCFHFPQKKVRLQGERPRQAVEVPLHPGLQPGLRGPVQRHAGHGRGRLGRGGGAAAQGGHDRGSHHSGGGVARPRRRHLREWFSRNYIKCPSSIRIFEYCLIFFLNSNKNVPRVRCSNNFEPFFGLSWPDILITGKKRTQKRKIQNHLEIFLCFVRKPCFHNSDSLIRILVRIFPELNVVEI